MIKKIKFAVPVLLGVFSVFRFTLAADLVNPLGNVNSFQGVVGLLGTWIFNLAMPIGVIVIIYAGTMMLSSAGNPKRYQSGINALKYAVIGLAILFIGKGFVSLVVSILGGPGK
jgi:hypothetical protein